MTFFREAPLVEVSFKKTSYSRWKCSSGRLILLMVLKGWLLQLKVFIKKASSSESVQQEGSSSSRCGTWRLNRKCVSGRSLLTQVFIRKASPAEIIPQDCSSSWRCLSVSRWRCLLGRLLLMKLYIRRASPIWRLLSIMDYQAEGDFLES